MEDYYKILGVPENASEEEIKKKFRELAKKHHPDFGGNPEKFKKILEAYRVLSDKKLRQEYDQKRKMKDYGFDIGNIGFNFDDLFRTSNLEDLIGDIFEDFFGTETRHHYEAKDIILDLEITLEELFKGTTKNISYKRKVICHKCDGRGSETKNFLRCNICGGLGRVKSRSSFFTGFIFETNKICQNCKGQGKIPEKICSLCQGRGYSTKNETVTINLPPKTNPREIIKIVNLGDQDPYSRKSGDLLVRIFVKPHPRFNIRGNDIISEIELTLLDLILGKKIIFDYLDEKIEIYIPPDFNEQFIKIPNKGINKGDLILKIKLKPIKKLTKRAKELLEELKKEIDNSH
ncbi:MAG: DnaJ domain-containing protein [Patescibacteria group bacterium]|nr:DnaJ domain-containing protein [Patescibacteria group bacterium]